MTRRSSKCFKLLKEPLQNEPKVAESSRYTDKLRSSTKKKLASLPNGANCRESLGEV